MNAYELADKLDRYGEVSSLNKVWQAARMLRQQADRISELEKVLIVEQEHNEMLEKDVSSKPVAWLWVHKGTTMNALLRNPMCDEYGKKHFEPKGWSSIPLYNHPVKQLSDEEMYKLAEQCGFNVDGKAINDGIETAADFHSELFMFARAIIKEITE